MAQQKSRWVLSIVTIVIIAIVLRVAFWPRAVAVDLAQVEVGDLIVTVDEEGRTRVHDSYVVATPVAGRLLRVGVEPGDPGGSGWRADRRAGRLRPGASELVRGGLRSGRDGQATSGSLRWISPAEYLEPGLRRA